MKRALDMLRWCLSLMLCLASCCAWAGGRVLAQEARVSASGALYYRTDTNSTSVWSPRTEVQGRPTDALTLTGVYSVDAWTSASVDIVTAATAPVHEVRHEINAGAAYTLGDGKLSASYRYSTEPDYVSNGGVLQATLDLANHNTTLVASLFGSGDVVGHALDRDFRELQYNLGGRLALTQVIDANMWAQLAWETAWVDGYQASPYRYVAVGDAGTCTSPAPTCLPEFVPDQRIRNALLAKARRALGRHVSVGLDYRFYFDSWSLRSQTVSPSLGWLITRVDVLSVAYRYYTQSEAEFYEPRYTDTSQSSGYVTRDKELSALYSHQLSLESMHTFELSAGASALTLGARASLTRFRYLAFVGLTKVHALEATLLLGFDLR